MGNRRGPADRQRYSTAIGDHVLAAALGGTVSSDDLDQAVSKPWAKTKWVLADDRRRSKPVVRFETSSILLGRWSLGCFWPLLILFSFRFEVGACWRSDCRSVAADSGQGRCFLRFVGLGMSVLAGRQVRLIAAFGSRVVLMPRARFRDADGSSALAVDDPGT